MASALISDLHHDVHKLEEQAEATRRFIRTLQAAVADNERAAPIARRTEPVQDDRARARRIARELLNHIERGTRDRAIPWAYLNILAEVACIEERLLATGGRLATMPVESER